MARRPIGRRIVGRYWRMLSPIWAHSPLSGEGAARNGGRFNWQGQAALYLSAEIQTAIAEYQQDLPRPGTLCAYDLSILGIVDLTTPARRKKWGVSLEQLHSPWREQWLVRNREPDTWTVTKDCLARGASGLLYPSLLDADGINLVLWRWGDSKTRLIEVLDPKGELPPPPR